MSDNTIRARLIKALYDYGCDPEDAAELADVLLTLPDITIVKLPPINSQTGNSWYCADGSAVWFDNKGGIRVRGTSTSGPQCLSDPRGLAAALLAAANTAEKEAK